MPTCAWWFLWSLGTYLSKSRDKKTLSKSERSSQIASQLYTGNTNIHTRSGTRSSKSWKVGPLSKTRKLGPQTHSHSPYWYLLTDYFNTLKLHCKRLMYFGLTCLAIGPEQCQFAKNGALKVGPCVCKTPEK